MPLLVMAPPSYVGEVRRLVPSAPDGPARDVQQRMLAPFGHPIAGLFAAGELGSAFGHLYMSGGNLAERIVGGDIAGRNAAGDDR